MKVVILGLSITSSWGNGHATGFRGLVRELTRRGDEVLFLERDVPWYAQHRDLPHPPWGQTRLYGSLQELDASSRRRCARPTWSCRLLRARRGGGGATGRSEHAAGARPPSTTSTRRSRIGKLRAGDREYLSPEAVREL